MDCFPPFIRIFMKICWSNLEKLKFTSNGNWTTITGGKHNYYEKTCKICNEEFLGRKENEICSSKCTGKFLKGNKNNKIKNKVKKRGDLLNEGVLIESLKSLLMIGVRR